MFQIPTLQKQANSETSSNADSKTLTISVSYCKLRGNNTFRKPVLRFKERTGVSLFVTCNLTIAALTGKNTQKNSDTISL
jgi:hypothetical protein